ncbi:MAG: glycosyltransferase [candidate division Zixibacteria bacterium]|nr:glycosyltransferase [candidate division Zixibacteria bacterium]
MNEMAKQRDCDCQAGLVSVIIPVYNRKEYLRQTIESVMQQTYTNIELLVVDDGSTDGSREIIDSYSERIIILEHPNRANKGQSAATNLAIKHAHGEFIAILDSDDFWEKDKLNIQVNHFNSNPDVGLVYCNGVAVNDRNEWLYNIYTSDHKENNKPEAILIDCYIFIPTNSLVKSSVFNQIGPLDESLRVAQDHDLAIRLAEATNFAYIDKKVFSYRRHKGSISNKSTKIRWINAFIILEKARQRYNYTNKVIRKRKAVINFRLAQCAIEDKRFLSALGRMILTVWNDPIRAFYVLFRIEKPTPIK